jgi:hypothetical protein
MNMNLSQLPPDLPRPVDNLALLKPLLKLRPFKTCLAAIMQHKHYLHNEMELMRTVADVLNCPVPPYLGKAIGPGQ